MAFWGKSFGEIGTLFKSSFGNAFADVNSKFDTAISNTEKLKATMSGVGQGLKGVFTKTKDSPLELMSDDEAQSKIVNFAKATQNGAVALQDFNSRLDNKGMKAYLAQVDAGKASLEGYKNYVNATNMALQKTTLASKAATLAMKTLSVAMNMGIMLVVSEAINLTVKGIDYLVNFNEKVAESNKQAIEKANELTSAYKQQSDEIRKNISTLEDLQNEFKLLSMGVDNYGDNISLSAAEYTRYKEIVQQIVGISPSLISGYDREGNAIAHKNGLLEKAIALQETEYKNRLKQMTSGDNLKSATEGAIAQVEEAKRLFNKIDPSSSIELSGIKIEADGTEKSGFANQIDRYISDVIGFKRNDWNQSLPEYIAENYDKIENSLEEIRKRAMETTGEWKGLSEQQSYDVVRYISEIINGQKEIEAAQKSFNPTLQIFAQSTDGYDKLENKQKDFIAQYVSGLKITGKESSHQLEQMGNDISNLVQKLSGNNAVQNAIGKLFSLDSTESIADYEEQVNSFISDISAGLGIDESEIRLMLKLDVDLEQLDRIKESITNTIGENQAATAFKNLNFEELQEFDLQLKQIAKDKGNVAEYARNAVEWKNNSQINSFLEENKKLLESGKLSYSSYNNALEDFAKELGLTGEVYKWFLGLFKKDLPPLPDFNSLIDTYQEKMKSAGETLEKLKNGSLNSDEVMDFMQSNPNLDWSGIDFSQADFGNLQEVLEKHVADGIYKGTMNSIEDSYGALERQRQESQDKYNSSEKNADDKKAFEDENRTIDEQLVLLEKRKNYLENNYNPPPSLAKSVDMLGKAAEKAKLVYSAYSNLYNDGAVSFSDVKGFLEEFKNVDGIEEYCNKLLDANTTASEATKILGLLTIESVRQQFTVEELANAEESHIAAMLKENGVANSSVIAAKMIARAKATQAVNTAIAKNATIDELRVLLDEVGAANLASEALALYNLKKEIASGKAFDNSESISSLLTEAKAAGVAATSIEKLTQLEAKQREYDEFYKGSTSAAGFHLLEDMSRLKEEIKRDAESFTIEFTPISYNGEGVSYTPPDSSKGKETKQIYDWIEVKLKKLTEATQKLTDKAKSYFNLHSKNNTLSRALSSVNSEIKANEKAFDKYMSKANSTGLSNEWKNKIQNGSFDINTVENEDLKEQIDSYQSWWEKAKACLVTINELKQTQKELAKEKFDNVLNYYDALTSAIKNKIDVNNSNLDYRKMLGKSEDDRTQQSLYKAQKTLEGSNLKKLQEERAKAQSTLNKLRKDMSAVDIKNAEGKLSELDSSIYDSKTAIQEWQDKLDNIGTLKFEAAIERLKAANDKLTAAIEIKNGEGKVVTAKDYQGVINNNNEQIKLNKAGISHFKELQNGLSKSSDKWKEYQRTIEDIESENRNLASSNFDLAESIKKIPIDNAIAKADEHNRLISKKESEMDLAKGKGKANKKEDYSYLISQSKNQIEDLASANKLLNKELAAYDVGSDKYKEVLTQIQSNEDAIRQCTADQAKWNEEIANLPIKKLDEASKRLEATFNQLKSILKLHEAQGVDPTSEDYLSQIDSLSDQITSAENKIAAIKKKRKDLKWSEDSELYLESIADIENLQGQILDSKIEQENLYNSLLDVQIKKLQDQKSELEKINDEYSKRIRIEEAIAALEKAKTQKTKYVYREGIGWTYEADQSAINSAQKELDSIHQEQIIDKFDEAIEAIEKLKPEYNLYDKDGNLNSDNLLLLSNDIASILKALSDFNIENVIGKHSQGLLKSLIDSAIPNLTDLFSTVVGNISGLSGGVSTRNDILSITDKDGKIYETIFTPADCKDLLDYIYSAPFASNNIQSQIEASVNNMFRQQSDSLKQHERVGQSSVVNVNIDNITLPNVNDANSFAKDLKDELMRFDLFAMQETYKR